MLNRKTKKRYYPTPKAEPIGDIWTYRAVVVTLAITVVFCIAGAIGLEIYSKPTPELLTAIATGAIGALAGILAPPPSNH